MIKLIFTFLLYGYFSFLISQPFPFEPDANTIGLWHLNEGTGDVAYDTSGNNMNGTLENGVSWEPAGMFGSCLLFSANYHRVRVIDNPLLDIAKDLTLDAWVKLDTSNNGSVILSKYNTGSAVPSGQYCFGISSNNKLYCYFCSDTSQFYINSDSIIVEFNEWILVSAVFSNSLAGLFINDEQVAAAEVPFDSLTLLEYPHDDLFIGDLWTDAYYPYSFDGTIDEVRISNIARYQINIAEIEEHNKNILPSSFLLDQNYPNPFNPSTKIKYSIPQTSNVAIKVFDILGNEIETLVSEEKQSGTYVITWYAENLPSGVYFYRLYAGDFIKTKKMVLLR